MITDNDTHGERECYYLCEPRDFQLNVGYRNDRLSRNQGDENILSGLKPLGDFSRMSEPGTRIYKRAGTPKDVLRPQSMQRGINSGR